MIEERRILYYTFVCDVCGSRGHPVMRRSSAEVDERFHECGVHREAHNSTGGFRGILGGYNRNCICGAHYVSDSAGEPFACPKELDK